MPKSKKRRKKKKSPAGVSPKRPARNGQIPIDIATEMKTAMQYHQAGRLHKADAIYRKVLSIEPNHPDALHMLGLIAHQANKNDAAAELIEKAISINPENSAFRNNLGNVYVALNRLDDAVACFEKAVQIEPNIVEAYINLGNALKYQGKTAAAEEGYRKALSINPNSVSACYKLAQLKHFKFMEHWKTVLPVPVLVIQYESLVEHQEALSKKMLAFCELKWNERCLSFYKNDRPVTTASGMQVRRKIYTSSIGRWKKYERFLGPLIESLGVNADMAT